MNATLAAAVADACAALGSAGGVIGDDANARFAVFYTANSICSQKMRAVLAQHGLGYASHRLQLFQGQMFLPAYVRLRMRGSAEIG